MQAACDRCHRRKSRCNKVKPKCGFCMKANADCCYSERSRDPSVRKEYIDGVERRLRQEEAKTKALHSELARLRSVEALRNREVSGSPQDVNQLSSPHQFSSGDVINEVSFLASTAAGERHYLGSTSGVLFADLVRASVDINPTAQNAAPRTGLLNSAVHQSNLKIEDSLPAKDLAKEFFLLYFTHDYICYPFLHPGSTFDIINSVYNDPAYYSKNPFQAFVFDMILAISTVNVYKYDWQMLPSAETHHTRAMNHATKVFQSGGLCSLQAILLLCQYRTSSSMQDTSASMWHLVGIAVRIAFELGLHRESAYNIQVMADESGETTAKSVDGEVRRRCFWSLLSMDRVVSITLGRPLAINENAIDVNMPSIENDYIITSEIPPSAALDVNRTSIFVHIVKYRLLCGKIMGALHGPKKATHDESAVRFLRDNLVSELLEWKQNIPDLASLELGASSESHQRRSSFLTDEWYEVIYHNAILMLFRPSPMLSDTGSQQALQKLFESSKEAVLLYASLHRSRKINYSWITLHSVFMAGLTYLYSLSRHFRQRRRPSPNGIILETDPTAIEIVNGTRACSNVLVAVSERWDSLRSCHEVFDRLSDAVLADAIKHQCSAPVDGSHAVPVSTSTTSTCERSSTVSEYLPDVGRTPYNSAWLNTDFASHTNGFGSDASPLAIDSEFRNCFGNLQNVYSTPFGGDSVMELSQDWLGYIDDVDRR